MTKGIHVTLEHGMTKNDAIRSMDVFVRSAQKKFARYLKNAEWKWQDGAGSFKGVIGGYAVRGTLRVSEKSVIIRGTLPLAIHVFFGAKIEEIIRRQAEEVFGA